MRTQLACVVLSVLAAGAAAQPPGTRTEPVDPCAEPSRIVTIRGCLNGTILTSTDRPTQATTTGLANPVGDRFRVVGDRELLAPLNEHQASCPLPRERLDGETAREDRFPPEKTSARSS